MINHDLAKVLPLLLGRPVATAPVEEAADQVESIDVQAVRAAAKGDQAAFAYLFETRVGKISRFVQNIVSNEAETEETISEVFITAWRKLDKLKEPERFDAWLFRIARNRALDNLRKKKPTQPLDGEVLMQPDPDPNHSPESSLEASASRQLIQDALLQLSEEQNEVLTLRFLVGMSHAEVATQLGKSVEAVRALQSRGIRQLRSMIG
jgi:RNA polymerase sigma-70 factor (ECF subfamily)